MLLDDFVLAYINSYYYWFCTF